MGVRRERERERERERKKVGKGRVCAGDWPSARMTGGVGCLQAQGRASMGAGGRRRDARVNDVGNEGGKESVARAFAFPVITSLALPRADRAFSLCALTAADCGSGQRGVGTGAKKNTKNWALSVQFPDRVELGQKGYLVQTLNQGGGHHTRDRPRARVRLRDWLWCFFLSCLRDRLRNCCTEGSGGGGPNGLDLGLWLAASNNLGEFWSWDEGRGIYFFWCRGDMGVTT